MKCNIFDTQNQHIFLGIVVLGTVGFKSYRAAISNPVDALRDE
jgi:hypothetical protein